MTNLPEVNQCQLALCEKLEAGTRRAELESAGLSWYQVTALARLFSASVAAGKFGKAMEAPEFTEPEAQLWNQWADTIDGVLISTANLLGALEYYSEMAGELEIRRYPKTPSEDGQDAPLAD